jgi:hypothetical protein
VNISVDEGPFAGDKLWTTRGHLWTTGDDAGEGPWFIHGLSTETADLSTNN